MFEDIESWKPWSFRRALERGGFSQRAFVEMGLEGVPFNGRAHHRFRASLPADSAVSTLARLFLWGEEVGAEELMRALGSETGPLVRLGLLRVSERRVASAVQLTPLADGWIASDFLRLHGEAPGDFVMGVGPATRLLATLTPRREGARVLELGCGAAWLAQDLRAAGLEVTASDCSGRALEIARFNARLNGLSGIEWLKGSWFEPVVGRKFDVIACNPPYVQSPGSGLAYRESTPGGENPCAQVLRGIVSHLGPGGFGCVVLNWSHASSDDWREEPLSWMPAAGVRRWLFQSHCHGPAEYAWRWIEHDPAFERAEDAGAELKRWLAHYREVGVGAISSGFMIVQRCEAGEEWTRTDSRMTGDLARDAYREIVRLFANESWLRKRPDDDELLDGRYAVPDGIAIEVRSRLGDGGWQDRTIRLTSPGRLSYDGQVDENLLRLLEILRQGDPPRRMVRELRAQPHFAEAAGLESQISGLVAELLRYSLIGLPPHRDQDEATLTNSPLSRADARVLAKISPEASR